MKLLYKPFALLFGLGGAFAARLLTRRAWALVDDREPPKPTTERASLRRVLGAAALQGVLLSIAGAAADRAGARVFQWLFGVWPGDREEPGA